MSLCILKDRLENLKQLKELPVDGNVASYSTQLRMKYLLFVDNLTVVNTLVFNFLFLLRLNYW